MTRPTTITINFAALRHNWQRIKILAPKSKVLAMVKANAYGHGAATIAAALPEADGFGVACLEEAIQLRQAGIGSRILLAQGLFDVSEVPLCAHYDLDVVLHHIEHLAMLKAAPPSKPLRVWLKINTGMNRLGFLPEAVPGILAALANLPQVQVVTLMTHMAGSAEAEIPLILQQATLFDSVTATLPPNIARSLANSALILRPELQLQADWVRPGIMLYGISPFTDKTANELGLKPVMRFQSALMSVYQAQAGQGVGYGHTWICPETMPMGIVAVGYGDGYPRHIEPGTHACILGQRVPIIGRVSMDMLALDLRAVPAAQVGTQVELWGENVPVEAIAQAAGTSPYELVTQITARVHRE
jgi:alanine racemase